MDDEDLFPGRGRRGRQEPQFTGPQEGKVVSVSAAGIRFTISDYDGGKHAFGPAPWIGSNVEPSGGHDHSATPPAVGATVLVVFVGLGVDRPWVIGWAA